MFAQWMAGQEYRDAYFEAPDDVDLLLGDFAERVAQNVRTFLEDGDKVAAFGVYSGTYKATGKSMRAEFAHLYVLKGGKIQSMNQYVDTVLVARATS